jgi:hypothetical protein
MMCCWTLVPLANWLLPAHVATTIGVGNLALHGQTNSQQGVLTMAKGKKKRSKSDRSRVAAGQNHEVYYVAKKFGVSADTVRSVIKRVGNSRAKIYATLEKM